MLSEGDSKATKSCLVESTAVSEGCATCYGDVVGCMFTQCDTVCSSESPECVDCLNTNNCTSEFKTCSGLDLFEKDPSPDSAP